MADVSITGADRLKTVARNLEAAGRGDLVKELRSTLRVAAKPLIPHSRAEALRRLPQSGGLARLVAKTPQRITVSTGRGAAVKLSIGKKGSGARAADAGTVRHPTFGRRPFVSQPVQPGWASDTFEQEGPAIREDVVRALDRFADRLVDRRRL